MFDQFDCTFLKKSFLYAKMDLSEVQPTLEGVNPLEVTVNGKKISDLSAQSFIKLR